MLSRCCTKFTCIIIHFYVFIFPYVFSIRFPLSTLWTPWKGNTLPQQRRGMWAQNWFLWNLQRPDSKMIGDGMQPPAAASRLSINITFGTSLNPQCQWFHNMKCVEFHPFIGILKPVKTSLFNIRIPKCIISWPEHLGNPVMRLLQQKFWCQIWLERIPWLKTKTRLSRNSNEKFNEGPLQTSNIQIHQKHVNLVQIYIICIHFPIAPNNFMRQTIASFLASPLEIPQHRLKT